MASDRKTTADRPGGRPPAPVRWLLRAGLAAAVVLAGVVTVAVIDANWRFARLEATAPARLFSAPFVLHDGLTVSRDDLAERLARLGYRRVEGHPQVPGEYATRFRAFEIHLNAFDYPEGRSEDLPLRVRIAGGRVRGLEDGRTGDNLPAARIEPEVLGTLSGNVREERVPLALADVSPALSDAVVAVEDKRFRRHPGIDPRAVARAIFANVRSGEVVQGGSTITQQLAKNLYENTTDRTLVRKVWETLAALGLEAFRTKDAILERYLNQVYLAQRGPISIVGVGAASRHYFGKEARYLGLPEAALLAGLIQSPGRYHPYRHPAAARERRNLVLRLMREEEMIGEDDYQAALAAPLLLRTEPSRDPRQAPYFADHVAQELQALGLSDPASIAGLRVFTTLDPLLQARADATLSASLARFEKDHKHLRRMPMGDLQGAVVALRPRDGAVLVMVGGRDYAATQFNRVTQARRQPGSMFKPFVYLAGFRKAQDAGEPLFTPATVLDDSPLEEEVNGELWAPRNFDDTFRGPVTARRALAESLNVPTIRAAEMIGLRDVVRAARQCGIRSPLQAVPSIALGTFEVTPLELAAAFTPIANLGARAAPRSITAVLDARGRPLAVPDAEIRDVTTPGAAFLVLDLMRDVVRSGTGASIYSHPLPADLAGKTGTTDDGRDAWFVGFSPDFLALVWVGFDNNRPLRLGGSALALPIWAMLAARAGLDPDRRWEPPDGLVEEEVDPTTGLLAGWRCPESRTEIFIAGTEPVEACAHVDAGDSWVTRIMNWFRRD